MTAKPNEGKALEVEVDGVRFLRIPIKTRLVGPDDDIVEVVTEYVHEILQSGDVLFVTEKIVAITQGRSYPVESITPRPLAVRLSKYVTKTPGGIGLGMPETMEMALRECGTPRILFAAAVAAITKLFGRRGAFYVVAGPKARGIDGPTSGTIPPYNSQVVLAPEKPAEVARQLKAALNSGAGAGSEAGAGPDVDVLIVDINDFGGNVLGSTLNARENRLMERVLADNPLGQGHQSTPLGVIRRA